MKEPEQDKPEDLSVKETAEADDAMTTTNSTAPSSAMASTTSSAPSYRPTLTRTTSGVKKVKPIPPPLDLNACHLLTAEQSTAASATTTAAAGSQDGALAAHRAPKSPGEVLPRECLPLRKRSVKSSNSKLNFP